MLYFALVWLAGEHTLVYNSCSLFRSEKSKNIHQITVVWGFAQGISSFVWSPYAGAREQTNTTNQAAVNLYTLAFGAMLRCILVSGKSDFVTLQMEIYILACVAWADIAVLFFGLEHHNCYCSMTINWNCIFVMSQLCESGKNRDDKVHKFFTPVEVQILE